MGMMAISLQRIVHAEPDQKHRHQDDHDVFRINQVGASGRQPCLGAERPRDGQDEPDDGQHYVRAGAMEGSQQRDDHHQGDAHEQEKARPAGLPSFGVAVCLGDHRHRQRVQFHGLGDLVGPQLGGLQAQGIAGVVEDDQGEARKRPPAGVAGRETSQAGVGLGKLGDGHRPPEHHIQLGVGDRGQV